MSRRRSQPRGAPVAVVVFVGALAIGLGVALTLFQASVWAVGFDWSLVRL